MMETEAVPRKILRQEMQIQLIRALSRGSEIWVEKKKLCLEDFCIIGLLIRAKVFWSK